MRNFDDILKTALDADEFVALILSRPGRGNENDADKLTVRPVDIRGERQYQWAARKNNQETHENLPAAETFARAVALFGPAFAHAHLHTTRADYSARLKSPGRVRISTSPPSRQAAGTAEVHNRPKQYLLPENEPCAFLAEIGVMTPTGQVKASHYRKFRQINRFLELVNDVVPHLPRAGELNVVDFGCGKSYLTFALHHLLTKIHRRPVRIVGLDRKADVVRHCQDIADRLECQGLEFRQGDIAEHVAESVHLAVSLHACDTATDDALAKAVAWQARVILAVPCCQHELSARLGPGFLPLVQQHGLLKDRLAAILTDALRAQALELRGYKTQVVEFIDLEHTAKNVLIRAIRRAGNPAPSEAALAAYQALKSQMGIDTFHLDKALVGKSQ